MNINPNLHNQDINQKKISLYHDNICRPIIRRVFYRIIPAFDQSIFNPIKSSNNNSKNENIPYLHQYYKINKCQSKMKLFPSEKISLNYYSEPGPKDTSILKRKEYILNKNNNSNYKFQYAKTGYIEEIPDIFTFQVEESYSNEESENSFEYTDNKNKEKNIKLYNKLHEINQKGLKKGLYKFEVKNNIKVKK